MNFKIISLSVITLFFWPLKNNAQTYNGKIVILFKDTLEGKITVDLTGENKGLVYIETVAVTKSKKKGEKTTTSTTERNGYNPAIITTMFINGKTYKFKNLRLDYKNENNLENCCVERIAGNDSIAIYQLTNKDNLSSYYTTTPRFYEYAENIEHPKYDDGGFKSFMAIKLSSCKSLGEKIYKMADGYFYENKTASLDEKLKVWKNIIRDYIACW